MARFGRAFPMPARFRVSKAPPTTPPGARTPPTLIAYTETTWTGNGAKSTGSVSWQTGDRIVVIAIGSSQFGVVPAPTASGLTFAAGTPIDQASTSWMNSWTATAGSNGSGTIDSTGQTISGAWGMAAWVYRGSDGFGTLASNGTTAKTISLTRSLDESAVVLGIGDTNAGSTSGYAWTPTIDNEREVQANANHTVYVGDWTDEDAAGSTSYGITGVAGSGNYAKIAIEILGAATAGDQAITLAEAGAATDTLTVSAAVPLPETGTATDTLTVTQAHTLPESGTGADALTVTAAAGLPEVGSAPDTLTIAAAVPLAQSGIGADALTVAQAHTLPETGTATDTLTVTAAVPLTQTGTATDTLSVSQGITKTLTESGAATDALNFDDTFVYDVLVLVSDSNSAAQTKIDGASSSAIIGFEAGTHYERKITPKLGQTLRGHPLGWTIFDGSRLVTGWTGSNPWVATHTVADRGVFIDVPTRSADAGTQYPEELFYETPGQLSGWTRKDRTGTPSTATPGAGQWTMSYAAGTLRVAEDPTAATVRISVTDVAVVSPSTSAGGLTIEDLTFAKYATDVFQAPAGQGTDHRDWTLRRCTFLDCHGANLYLGPGDTVTRCRIAYAGNSGFQNECELGGYIAGQTITDSEVAYSMQAPWNQDWGGGGSKFDLPTSGSGGLVIRNCWWHHNRMSNIWTDLNTTETSTGNLIESNLIEDGEITGIFHEIGNPTTLIRWNRIQNCGTGAVTHIGSGAPADAESAAGIDISNSRNTTVQSNVVENCRTGIMVRDDNRSPFLDGANVTDNSVKATDGNTVKFRPDTDATRIATCGADLNRYWSNTFSYNNVFGLTFATWQTARTGPGLTGALDPNGTGGLSDPVTDPTVFVPFSLRRYGSGKLPSVQVPLTESGIGADSLSVSQAATPKTLPEAGTGADSLTVTAAVPLAETGTGTDSLTVAAAVPLTQSGTGTDSLTSAVPITLSDTGTGTDSLTVTAAVPLPESGTASDSLTAAVTLTLPETGAATDGFTIPKLLAETGTATDTLTVTVAVPLPETGTGADSLTVTAALTLAEVAIGVDALASAVPITVGEAGAGADALTVSAAVPLAESGTATDTLPVAQTRTLTETGTGADALSVSVTVAKTLAEAASGNDTLRVTVTVGLAELAAAADTLAATVLLTLADTGSAVDTLVAAEIPLYFKGLSRVAIDDPALGGVLVQHALAGAGRVTQTGSSGQTVID